MIKPQGTFQSFYQTHLQNKLIELDKKKYPALFATAYMRIGISLFFIIFFSIWLGFVSMFMFEAPWFIKYFFGGFFALVGFLVLYGNIRKYVYQDILRFFPNSSEDRRLINLITVVSVIGMMAVALLIGRLYLGSGDGFNGDFFFRYAGAILFLFGLGITMVFVQMIGKGFFESFKKEVINGILSYFDAGLSYNEKGKITKKEFLASKLFVPEVLSSYKGNDLITGKDGKTSFRFSQLEVQERRTGAKGKTKVVEIFKGLFFVADFNKSLQGNTLITPDVARELFGEVLGEKLNKLGLSKEKEVKFEQMESVEFEKLFTVYSSDPIEARFVLSPKLQERLVQLRQKLNYDFSVSFNDHHMYLAIESGKDFYAPAMFSSIDNQSRAEEIKDFIESILQIPESLDLNTRIWTVE